VGFEPAVTEIEHLQTYILNRMATEIGKKKKKKKKKKNKNTKRKKKKTTANARKSLTVKM
jgi:hypothetical protein